MLEPIQCWGRVPPGALSYNLGSCLNSSSESIFDIHDLVKVEQIWFG